MTPAHVVAGKNIKSVVENDMIKKEVKVSTNHKNHDRLHEEIEEAEKRVTIGGIYSHYKYPENTYKVLSLGFFEPTDEICVIYQAMYDPMLVFIRPLVSWLETIELDGKKMPRFKFIG